MCFKSNLSIECRVITYNANEIKQRKTLKKFLFLKATLQELRCKSKKDYYRRQL